MILATFNQPHPAPPPMHDLNHKLNTHYPGKVVRKDLTKRIKEGANVPVYVLEYLLGMYCATEDETTIEEGLERVKKDSCPKLCTSR